MKKIKVLSFLISFPLTTHLFAAPQVKTITSTHVYKNFAIQDIDINQSGQFYSSEILISGSHFEIALVDNKTFRIPQIDKPIWSITAKDLHVPEEACLDIDATLCRITSETGKSAKSPCYDTCITNGPHWLSDTELQYDDVTYNDKSQRIPYATKENIINIINGDIIRTRMVK